MKKVICILLTVFAIAGLVTFAGAKYYNANASLWTSGNRTQVRASHILVSSQEEAIKIKNDIETGKMTFEQAAMRYSTCPSAQNGGDLGYFGRNRMVVPFERAAFSLPVGMISDPVKTQFGYHLIKVTGERF